MAIVADPYLRLAPSSIDPENLPYTEVIDDNWRPALEKEMNRQYSKAQVHVHHLKHLKDQRSAVMVCLNHTVADGHSAIVVARDLIELYNGREVPALPHGPGVEDRFPMEFQGLRGWWGAIRFISVLGSLGPALQIGSAEPTQDTGSEGFTFQGARLLNARARENGSNFFGLFSAVVLKSLHQLYSTNQNADHLSLNTPVSLRAATGVQDREIGVFIAGHLGLYSVSVETDVWQLAKECFDTLRRGVQEGRPFHFVRLARGSRKPKPPWVPKKQVRHRPTVSISNMGMVDKFPKAGTASLTELHLASAQSVTDPFSFVLTSYGAETFIDLQFSHQKLGRDAAKRILDSVREKLAAL
jgi:hypothetical protein